MPGVEVVTPQPSNGVYPVASCRASGPVTASLARATTVEQWLVTASLPAGTAVEWLGGHGDEAIHVAEGALDVSGRTCDAGGAVIVEAGARPTVIARTDCRIVHVGPTSADVPTGGPFGPPAVGARGVHVVGPEGIGGVRDYDDGSKHAVWFTDGTCPRCRIMFFRVWGDAGSDGPSHSHSQDELIHVTRGTLRIGPSVARPATTVAIPGDRRYGFRTTEPWDFLNYRRDMSFMTIDPGGPALMETA
jgi:quercetin dioxygenase-like cupin family protein